MKLESLEAARKEIKKWQGDELYLGIASQCLCEKPGMRREGLFMEFVSFITNPDGTPRYENTIQYAY